MLEKQGMAAFSPVNRFLLADGAAPALRTRALSMLYAKDAEAGKKAAATVLDKYLDGELDQVNEMALVLVAAQILAKEKQTGKFASALKQALKDKMWAKRVTADESDITKATVDITPPLVEALIKAAPEEAQDLLAEIVKDKASPVRAEAAFVARKDAAVDALLDGLSHRTDGWLRLGCYTALAAISGQDHFCDWLFASQDAADTNAKKYRDLAKQRGK